MGVCSGYHIHLEMGVIDWIRGVRMCSDFVAKIKVYKYLSESLSRALKATASRWTRLVICFEGIFWGWTKEVEPNECPGWGGRASVAPWNDKSFVIAASCCRRWSVWVLDFSRSSAMFGSKRDLQLRRGSFWLLYFQHLNQAFSEWHWAHCDEWSLTWESFIHVYLHNK